MRVAELQKWFGAQLQQPPEEKCKDAPYIKPGPVLKAHERLEIYHEQYWWRLLKCLQDNFPSLTHLFGHEKFNKQIGVPYLSDHPPDHWALCRLGQSLPGWMRERFTSIEKELAHIDAAMQHAFWCGASKTLLQPHVHLFALDHDLFAFREQKCQGDLEKRRCFFALYRSAQNHVKYKELSEAEHRMLVLLREKNSIDQACSALESCYQSEAEEFISVWFHQWTVLGWLRLSL